MMIWAFYQLLTILFFPVLLIYLGYRKWVGKEDPKRFFERLGKASCKRPKGKLLWIHAASVGESLSILPLINRLTATYPKLTILVTTGTITSAAMMTQRLPKQAVHQYIPIDNWFTVSWFLFHWKPDLALMVESELWPCLVKQSAKKCPVMVINARMSDRSYRRWMRFSIFTRSLFGSYHHVLAQSGKDALRYRHLGAKNAIYIGNIKYDAPPLSADEAAITELQTMIGNRPVFLAASTHPDEEKEIARAHREVKISYPDLLTIIVPRHPQRAAHIIQQLVPDTVVVQRSVQGVITPQTDIYLADTMGELGIFYRLASIVFIGGTLVPHGGQNPLEAARLNNAIIFGPHMDNFLQIKKEFLQQQAAIEISDTEALSKATKQLLRDSKKRRKLAEMALQLVQEKTGATDEICKYIESLLDMKPLIRKG